MKNVVVSSTTKRLLFNNLSWWTFALETDLFTSYTTLPLILKIISSRMVSPCKQLLVVQQHCSRTKLLVPEFFSVTTRCAYRSVPLLLKQDCWVTIRMTSRVSEWVESLALFLSNRKEKKSTVSCRVRNPSLQERRVRAPGDRCSHWSQVLSMPGLKGAPLQSPDYH
jgi:hypothetical protein